MVSTASPPPKRLRGDAASSRSTRDAGLGSLSPLPDEAIVLVLGFLSPQELGALSCTSRALYCFASWNELWKGVVLEGELGQEVAEDGPSSSSAPESPSWVYRTSWKATWLSAQGPRGAAEAQPSLAEQRRLGERWKFYSELLYRAWLCAHLDPDPAWLEEETVERRSGLSPEEFSREYERQNRPVILTDAVDRWPALQAWSRDRLDELFQAEAVCVNDAPWTWEGYRAYAEEQEDELPLYLFDPHILRRRPGLARDAPAPAHFARQDLFRVLGDRRPDWRWLILGPSRSGSTFHVDPNATCAWNAVVWGAKRWVLYPPHCTPPGVRASADGGHVACPPSPMDWYLGFYSERAAGGVVPLQCTLRAGEVLFVPREWWHMALNLKETLAVTQNYVCAANLGRVLDVLATENVDLISGLADLDERRTLHRRFLAALQEQAPEALREARECEDERMERIKEKNALASLFKSPAEAVEASNQVPFTFNFAPEQG
ncbi:hypothetical protein H632_c72p1 [Helicosporidium sp. ATCC 50920]|nr:hypothetical protein H632_c72p1 [Helicosporidium sp. ATCC 50920]|eukprot:KDD76900.1 hypothetical protein H632_c72p1 [Helicosporidium sp. ATCC 50920]